jgi:mannose-1-phosphate guanylyltransferase
VITTDARGCTVVSRSGRLVAVAGVDNLVVIDTPDAVLVVPSDRAQLVKAIVDHLQASGRDELL